MSILVIRPGPKTTIQSAPRHGWRHVGMPAAGPADPLSMTLANRLVENAPVTSALEILLGPVELQFDVDTHIAITGGSGGVVIGGRSVPPHQRIAVTAGNRMTLARATIGARMYVAVAGGLRAASLLGSTSTYLPAAIGGHQGRSLVADDRLSIAQVQSVENDLAATSGPPQTPRYLIPFLSHDWMLRCVRGPEYDRLTFASRDRCFGESWMVGVRCGRMGIRLCGEPLVMRDTESAMTSEPVFPGTVQCPPDGMPFVLSVDAQTTGGYPRIANLIAADRHRLGQIRTGDRVHLREVTLQQARQINREKQSHLQSWLGKSGANGT